MDELGIRREMCEIGKMAFANGYVAANDGNFSVKLSANEFLCTPTGVSKGLMTPDMICRVGADGTLLEKNGGYRPSSEIKMHLRVYERREDVFAVVHTHSPYATAFAASRKAINQPIMTEAVVLLGCVPLAGYATPGTDEVPDSIEEFLPFFDSVLLSNHGVLTWGKDLTDAWYKTESAEHYARVTATSALLGGSAPVDTEQLKGLYEIRRRLGFPMMENMAQCPGKKTCGVCTREGCL